MSRASRAELSPEVLAMNQRLPDLWKQLGWSMDRCAGCGLILPTGGGAGGLAGLANTLVGVQKTPPAALAAAMKACKAYFREEQDVQLPSNVALAGLTLVSHFELHKCPRCGRYVCRRCAKEPHGEGGCVLCS